MADTNKLTCPVCGAAMNHHAVKIEYDSDEPASLDFEGVLKNVHTCPECGDVEMTTAP
jgi:ribosomal protein S27AE